jgi:hypothetical protein
VVAATPTRKVRASAVVLAALFASGCGSAGNSASPRPADQQALRAYVRAIEPVRHRVDRLLNGTDPILRAYRYQRLSAGEAQRRLRRIERRFVTYVNAVAAVRSVPPDLMAAQRAYAHTYALEDMYLRALIAVLPSRRWDRLPRFTAEQRRIIVQWRAALALEAARVQVPLPDDIQSAGRGEIAPSPRENS